MRWLLPDVFRFSCFPCFSLSCQLHDHITCLYSRSSKYQLTTTCRCVKDGSETSEGRLLPHAAFEARYPCRTASKQTQVTDFLALVSSGHCNPQAHCIWQYSAVPASERACCPRPYASMDYCCPFGCQSSPRQARRSPAHWRTRRYQLFHQEGVVQTARDLSESYKR